ncbi:transmembrane protein 136-like [Acanthaster planci]|uniref:Transmembrane protein 136-like n=1 Tax=Acanthaster planci TaxID=133434 RepID=A0A8B7Y063_ACAPL|nr:transmembrane protein 136-like [Acanthaster planci]
MELSPAAILFIVVTSFTLWSALHGLQCLLLPHQTNEWNYRVVVTVHSVTMLVLGAAFELFIDPWRFPHLVSPPGQPSNSKELATLAVCLGYFIYDSIYTLYSGKTVSMNVHHAVCVAGLCVALTSAVSGAEILFCLFLGELTNPLLQVRFFLRAAGMTKHILYEVNDVLFLVTFIVIRIGLGSYLLYCVLMDPVLHLFYKTGGIALHLISVVFMGEMLTVSYKKYIQKKNV